MSKSFRDVFKISLPLVVSSLSGSIMLLLDRMMLMNYSIQTFNAVSSVIVIYNLFAFSGSAIIGISEVFIGNHNGQKNYSECSKVTWQMIWASLCIVPIVFLLGGWIGKIMIPGSLYSEGVEFFDWIIFCVPVQFLLISLISFFVGVQSVSVIVVTTIISNIINIVLDWMLIFGCSFIPALGGKGAALATFLALNTQFLLLFICFLSKKYRKKYHTNKPLFSFSILKSCWNIGFPNTIGYILEIGAIYVAFVILSRFNAMYITALAVGQTLIGTLICVTDGMRRGIISITSNAIGSQNCSIIPNILKSHIKVFVFAIISLFFILMIFYDKFVFVFNQSQSDGLLSVGDEMFHVVLWVCCFLLFDGIAWMISGVLTAFKDTKFIMYTSSLNIWFWFTWPLYFIATLALLPRYIWFVASFDALMLLFIFFLRYSYFKRKGFLMSSQDN